MQESTVEIPEEFVCPISSEIMTNPVLAEDGETYEKEAIEKYFASKLATTPNTEENLKAEQKKTIELVKITSPLHAAEMGTKLTPNLGIFRQIKKFLESNPSLVKESYFEEGLRIESLEAIQIGSVESLNRLIEKDKRLLEKEIKPGKKLIDVVCEEGTPELLRIVIKAIKKWGTFEFSNEKLTPLILSCLETMQKEGINVFILEANWQTERWQDFFKYHLKQAGELKIIEAFVSYNFISLRTALDEQKNTALHLAIINKQPGKVKKLILLGANTKIKNASSLDAKELAKIQGDDDLVENISQWKHEKRSALMHQEIVALKDSNHALALKLTEMEGDNARLKALLAEKADRQDVLFISGRFFRSYVRRPVLTSAQKQKQEEFLTAISLGNIEKVSELHKSGAFVDRPNAAGLFPLVAAAYSGSPDVFYYIEAEIKDSDELTEYYLMIELERVLGVIKKLIPDVRPQDATYDWIGRWYKDNANKFWCEKYDQAVGVAFEDKNWSTRKNLWFQAGVVFRDCVSYVERDMSKSDSGYRSVSQKEHKRRTEIMLNAEGVLIMNHRWESGPLGSYRNGVFKKTFSTYYARESIQTSMYSRSRDQARHEELCREGWETDNYYEGKQWYRKTIPEHIEEKNHSVQIWYLPSPEAHDKFVSELIQALNKLQGHVIEKVQLAKVCEQTTGLTN